MRSRDVDIAVNRDVFWAVSRAVYDGAVYGDVGNDPEPPALQDSLREVLT